MSESASGGVTLPSKLFSRKLWLTLLGLGAGAGGDQVGLDLSTPELICLTVIICVYLVVQAWVDVRNGGS